MINNSAQVLGDINVNNFNSFGLLSSYGNIYGEGNIYLNNKETGQYTYIENNGKITCENINMENNIIIGENNQLVDKTNNTISIGNNAYVSDQGNNSISIGNNTQEHNQNENSIILNASGLELSAVNSGLYIDPIRNENSDYLLNYNLITKEITYSDYITGSTGA